MEASKRLRLQGYQPSSEEVLRLQHLNYDCLKEIFKHLDLPSQFSVMKSCQSLQNIILYDIWHKYAKNGFDFNTSQEMANQTVKFQSDALKVVLNNFDKIRGISLEIFNACFEEHTQDVPVYTKVKHLSITNVSLDMHDHILDAYRFSCFPNLVELKLKRVAINFHGEYTFSTLKILSMEDICMLNDIDGEFLQKVLTPKLEKLSLISLPYDTIHYENFSSIPMCKNLKEMIIGAEYLHDSRILTPVSNLLSLKVLILHSKDCFYFKSRDHCIFTRILKLIYESREKNVEGIQMNGVPSRSFFDLTYLSQITYLNWMVSKMIHRKSNNSADFTDDVPEVLAAFYDFIGSSRNLKTVYVRDNVFHMKNQQVEWKVHHSRATEHLPPLNIVSDYKDVQETTYIGELKEGSMKFIFK